MMNTVQKTAAIDGNTVLELIQKAYIDNICACWFVDAEGITINGSVDDLIYYPDSKSIQLIDDRDSSITIDFEKATNWTSYEDIDTVNYECVCPAGLLTISFATE